MAASVPVVFYLGGDDMSEENQWPKSKPSTPITPTTPTTPQSPTSHYGYSLSIDLQKMNPNCPEKHFGF